MCWFGRERFIHVLTDVILIEACRFVKWRGERQCHRESGTQQWNTLSESTHDWTTSKKTSAVFPGQVETDHNDLRPFLTLSYTQAALRVIIPSTHPSTPSIIITLAPPQSREMSSCIPYQNQAFGNLLPVPSHPVFNTIHPPMSLDSNILPYLDNWQWENGHWETVLPSLEEQHRRGLFSRAISSKRKACRSLVCVGSKGRRCRWNHTSNVRTSPWIILGLRATFASYLYAKWLESIAHLLRTIDFQWRFGFPSLSRKYW